MDSLNLDLNNAVLFGIHKIKDELWLTTDQGIWIVHHNKVVRRIRKSETVKYGLTSDFISAIHYDRQGNIWLG
ncbi:MAG: ligand-binding sensor domain-containing protein, partial [Bacteroidia bacterium]